MRRLPPASAHGGWEVRLPPAVEELLIDVVADGFVLCCCGDRVAPIALVAFYEWECWLDLLTIHSFDKVTAARVPKYSTMDVLTPEVVVWAYEGPPQQALRALLNLMHPAHPDAPTRAANRFHLAVSGPLEHPIGSTWRASRAARS